MSYSSTQCRHYLPRDSVRFSRLRALSYKTVPCFRLQSQSPVVLCTSDWLALNQRFPWPSPWLWLLFAMWLRELRETFYLVDDQFIVKGCNAGAARWKRCIRQGMRKRCQSSMSSPGMTLSQHLQCVHQPGSSSNSIQGALWQKTGWGRGQRPNAYFLF